MEKFVKSVNIMDETILVPCRLMDLKVGDAQDVTEETSTKKHGPKRENIKDLLSSADLFDLFNMLNSVKVDLLWAQTNGETVEKVETKPVQTKGHIRRPSTVSMASTNSAASVISDSESDTGNENDSGIEAEEPVENKDPTLAIANNFRRHLNGLYTSLQQLTDAANYLTKRYQHDVGSTI